MNVKKLSFDRVESSEDALKGGVGSSVFGTNFDFLGFFLGGSSTGGWALVDIKSLLGLPVSL